MLRMEAILRMEMIPRLARDGMDSSNGMIQNIPAQSANFQPMAPFQHVVLSSNPSGIPI